MTTGWSACSEQTFRQIVPDFLDPTLRVSHSGMQYGALPL